MDLLNAGGVSGRPLQGPARPNKMLLQFLRQQRAPPHRVQFGFHDPEKAIHHEKSCSIGANNHARSDDPMAETHKSQTGHLNRFNNEKRDKKHRKRFVRPELLNLSPGCRGKCHAASKAWSDRCGHDLAPSRTIIHPNRWPPDRFRELISHQRKGWREDLLDYGSGVMVLPTGDDGSLRGVGIHSSPLPKPSAKP
jgi:hypothetical protein